MGSWVVEVQATKSIYKVPPFISKTNKTAYKPRLVSFGPYHHGDPQLAWMEAHKKRAYLCFINRSGRNDQEVYDIVAEKAQDLKDSYDSLDSKWKDNTDTFVKMMILDGCFMFEVLHVYKHYDYYSDYDPIFGPHGNAHVMHLIKADMLLLENQLPMLLLRMLIGILTKNEEPALPLELLDPKPDKFPQMGKCVHVLDLYRKGLLQPCNEHGNAAPQSANQGEGDPKTGKDLHERHLWWKRLLHPHNKLRYAV